MGSHVLMLAAVLRELGQQVWQSNIAHSLKQSVHAVSAFSSAWLAEDGEMKFSVRCGQISEGDCTTSGHWYLLTVGCPPDIPKLSG